MSEARPSTQTFSLTSSTAHDVWHGSEEKDAYEWWYFDAISDDGRDAVVIIFLDNFIFSPRYNRLCMSSESGFPSKTSETSETSKTSKTSETCRFPALAFFYYRDGKPLLRCINEVTSDSFSASKDTARCRIGESEFEFGAAAGGDGYRIAVRGVMQGGRRLEADFEWVNTESDLGFEENGGVEGSHNWNLVAPRAEVTGKIDVLDGKAPDKARLNFRGTGYHDHNHDTRWLPEAVKRWQWGRVHFHDATAVFYDFEPFEGERVSRLITLRNGKVRVDRVRVLESAARRDVFGLSYPSSLTFVAEDGLSLTVKNSRPVDSSFFYLRFMNESTITFPDGDVSTGKALTECLAPKALRFRWLDWLVDMRIGREGRGAFLK